MRVDKINSQNFQAKHPKIREMDKVLRIINSSYPTFSTSKFSRANSVDKNNDNNSNTKREHVVEDFSIEYKRDVYT